MASDPPDRLSVIVDSYSPSIQYEGERVQTSPTADMMNLKKFDQPPFSDMLFMAPKGKTVSLTHTFNGTRIDVQGTIISPYNENRWKAWCTVDGQVLELNFGWNSQENQASFCEGRYLLSTNPHVLNFTIEAFDDQSIWFDRLMISPRSSTDSLDYPLVQVEYNDPNISYEPPESWVDYVTGQYAKKTGAKAIINFNGTALRWYSVYAATFSSDRSQTRGTMLIDGSQDIPFTIPAVNPSTDVQLGDRVFRTPELSPGLHRVEVFYEAVGRPLALHYLVVENTGAQAPTNDTVPKSPNTPIWSPTKGLSTASNVGIGVGAGMALILILGLLLFVTGGDNKAQGRSSSR